MPRTNGSDPATADTPVPLEGDGHELIGLLVDGRYRLDATLGRGGMGLVYRAAHVGLRRQVAVKILHPSLAASPEVRNRFEREALAVGKIDHPNCVSVYDVGRLPGGALYLAMELLEGRSLADVLDEEGQLSPGRALHILAGILRGLAHIHHARLIHRDLKPENIFLIRHGEDEDFPKILDFGIAKPMAASDLDDGVKLTQAGMAFGTPIYMAPEQALGDPMDGRADLYAASVLTYEMLCGQPPFYSDDKLEVMSMHAARPVPPMRQRLARGGRPVPSSIERLVLRGLTKKPADRYASAEEYLAEVEHALRTPDGGVTEVEVARRGDTGAEPLITADGQVRISGAMGIAPAAPSGALASSDPSASHHAIEHAIEDAIEDAIQLAAGGALDDVGAPAPPAPPPPGSADAAGSRDHIPRGGVGLGLPYTGPNGEPVFGSSSPQPAAPRADTGVANELEPDPRPATAVPELRRRLGLYAVIGTCAVALGVAVALITARLDDEPPPSWLDPATPAGAANQALGQGDPARALQLLEANRATLATDAGAQLVLGHVRAARNEPGPALAAYERALALAPAIESDDKLRAALRAMAGNPTDHAIVAQAFALWVGHTADPQARRLVALAAVSDDLARRKVVRPVIERHQLGAQVDWLKAYSLDLEQDAPCEARREAVARLRALGDRRAIAALERALIRVGNVGIGKGNRKLTGPINGCLVEDGKAAIGYLRGLPP